MIIPGWLVALVTFPGVIVHEAAHFFFCKLRRVAVFDVCYLRFGNPVGYVIHEQPRDFMTSFLISTGPFLINSLLCFLICFPASIPRAMFDRNDPIDFLLLWVGVSIGMHAFPSTQDASVLRQETKRAVGRGNPFAILAYPVVALIYVANVLSIFWFDYIYGLAIGLALPAYLLNHLA